MADAQIIEFGWDELDKKLEELPAKLQEHILKQAIGAGSEVMAEEARRRVPVRTGMTQASIVAVRPRLSGNSIVGGVTILKSTKVPRWWWLEFGTSKMAARSFLRPAGLASAQAAIAAVMNVIRTEVERVWKAK